MDKGYCASERMRVIHEICGLLNSDMEFGKKTERALAKMMRALGGDASALFIEDDRNGRPEISASAGCGMDWPEDRDFDSDAGCVAAMDAPVNSTYVECNLNESGEELRCVWTVPLFHEGRKTGCVRLGYRERTVLNEEDSLFFKVAAFQFAQSIERDVLKREIAENITELENARREMGARRQQMAEMDKLQELASMAASIKHQINNPLTAIIGNIDLILLASPDLDAAIRKKLHVALEEARRIAEITKKAQNAK